MPLPTQEITLKNWKGLNAWGPDEDIDPSYLIDLQNVDFDEDGEIRKRRGTSRVNLSLGAAINGIYDFQSQQGFLTSADRQRVVIVAGSTLHVIKNFNTAGQTDEATFAASNNLHYFVATDNGACFTSNEAGSAAPKLLCILGSTTWSYVSAALSAPASAPTVGAGSSGSLSGTYSAQYSYQDIFGNETNPSPASPDVGLTNQQLNVGVTASSDGTVSLINLYVLTPNGSQYKFSRTASNVTATISHSASDATVNAADSAPSANDPCPYGKYIAIYNGMLVVAGDATITDQVFVSNPQFMRQFSTDTDFVRVASGDGQPVRGFGREFGELVIAKADSLFVAEGADNETFKARPRNHEYGVLGQPSIAFAAQNMVFFSDDGIYVDDSLVPKEISGIIRNKLRTLNPANLACTPPKQVAATYKYYKQCLFSVREATGAGENDTVYVYNYENGTWTRWTGCASKVFGVVQNDDDYEFLYGGDSSGNIWRYSPPNGGSPNSDNHTGSTTAISAYVITPWIHLPKLAGVTDWERSRTVPRYIRIYAGGEPASGNTTISLVTNYYTDFSATIRGTFTTTHTAAAWPAKNYDPKTIYYGGALGTFNWLKLKISNATLDEHFFISKIVLGFKTKPSMD